MGSTGDPLVRSASLFGRYSDAGLFGVYGVGQADKVGMCWFFAAVMFQKVTVMCIYIIYIHVLWMYPPHLVTVTKMKVYGNSGA